MDRMPLRSHALKKDTVSRLSFVCFLSGLPEVRDRRARKYPVMQTSGPTCFHVESTTGIAWVISTNPRSPIGVGARSPPMILGAMKAITL